PAAAFPAVVAAAAGGSDTRSCPRQPITRLTGRKTGRKLFRMGGKLGGELAVAERTSGPPAAGDALGCSGSAASNRWISLSISRRYFRGLFSQDFRISRYDDNAW